MYESDAKDATSLYVTCLDEDPQKNDLIGDCVINMVRVMEYGEQDGMFLKTQLGTFIIFAATTRHRAPQRR
jgi:hypothetical protein